MNKFTYNSHRRVLVTGKIQEGAKSFRITKRAICLLLDVRRDMMPLAGSVVMLFGGQYRIDYSGEIVTIREVKR